MCELNLRCSFITSQSRHDQLSHTHTQISQGASFIFKTLFTVLASSMLWVSTVVCSRTEQPQEDLALHTSLQLTSPADRQQPLANPFCFFSLATSGCQGVTNQIKNICNQ